MTTVRSIDELFGVAAPKPAATASSPLIERGSRFGRWLYSLTIFLSAFLLFQVQPLIAKLILPWFGGTAGVWSTCMVCFQVLLFAGYAYAHITTSRLTPRKQGLIHAALLIAACAALPIVPSDSWKPAGDEEPVWRIVGLLAVTVGLPFFALSATGPLLQGWFSRTYVGRSPYRLYALSNAGSLLALITFPAVFDWLFATRVLARLWSWSFVSFAALCAICAWIMARHNRLPVAEEGQRASPETVASPSPSLGTRLLWFALAMVPSVLLLATTNQVCLDVASVPFLWVLPLTLYLLSFILCFDNDRWYSRRFVMPSAVVAIVCVSLAHRANAEISVVLQILAYFTALFLCAMVCHGELARRRPPAQHLTAFYLLMAAGGAAGGIFVGIASPQIFNDYYELHLGLLACAAILLIVLYTDHTSFLFRGRPRAAWVVMLGALSVFAVALLDDAQRQRKNVIAVGRIFYGVLRVLQERRPYGSSEQSVNELSNGGIVHGTEYTAPGLRTVPTTYYDPGSGIGRVLSEQSELRPRRVGVIGLGAGTLAAYALPGDDFRFYEINPLVERMARAHFHYLGDCRGKVDVVLGDGRLKLERDSPQNFDVLVLDAFSGEAIPVHLLTVEAFAIYLRHLAPDGIIAVHVSNRHFMLGPVVDAVSHAHGLTYAAVVSQTTRQGGRASLWVLVARKSKVLQTQRIREAALPTDGSHVLWTDDHASLLDVW
ncbi:MAG TPA: fused MFS/spermidine synthase [Planctomycetaceae bacterium]|jgi:SAM-dependent methyltransferase|nr:fused MFS/spermidine synthase [Planctomycetaceae bacterium]